MSKKQNKNGSRVRNYELVRVTFPKNLHNLLRGLRGKKIEVKGYREGKTTHIMLVETEEH